GAGSGGFARSDISPDGRLLAVGMDAGAQFWDLRTGREVAKLPTGTTFVAFDGPSRRDGAAVSPQGPPWSLLTGGAAGLFRRGARGPGGGRVCRGGGPRGTTPRDGVGVWARRASYPACAGRGLCAARMGACWERRRKKASPTRSWTSKRERRGGSWASIPTG